MTSFSSVLLVWIRSHVPVLLPRLNYNCHCIHVSSGTELSRILPESRYIASTRPHTETPVVLLVGTDRTENISHGSYCCVRNITPRTSHVTPSEFIGALTAAWQQAINICNSIVACVFQGFRDSTVLAWGKYATIWFVRFSLICIVSSIFK
jgi:hypothetical protein